MRMLRLSLVGTVSLALLGGLGVATLGQAEPEYATAGTWMALSQERCGTTTSLSRLDQPNGDYQVRGLGATCAALGDDPRFGSPMRVVLNEDCFADGGCINWGTIEQPGADGTWSGWFAGTEDPGANTYLTIVMTGSGGYEGLTHIRHATGPFSGPLDHAGVVFEGAPPPLLAMPEPSE
jgi:hypothetical protein